MATAVYSLLFPGRVARDSQAPNLFENQAPQISTDAKTTKMVNVDFRFLIVSDDYYPTKIPNPVAVQTHAIHSSTATMLPIDRRAILGRLALPSCQGDMVIERLNEKYPGLGLVKILGKGTFSEAQLFFFRDGNGKVHKKVLKLARAETSKKSKTSFGLSEKRMGGEWMALLGLGEHVIKTESALVLDNNKKEESVYLKVDNPNF